MITTNEIRDEALRYLKGDVDFEAFEDWLIDHSWNMHKDSAADAQCLARNIEHYIYEYLDGITDEAQLKETLRSLVDNSLPVKVTGMNSTTTYAHAEWRA